MAATGRTPQTALALSRLSARRLDREKAEYLEWLALVSARDHGASWALIGLDYDISRQAAESRWGARYDRWTKSLG